jgi:hypothetical protein
MTSNCYIIDTSSLIELNKHNPMDVYPGVWQKIEQLINKDRLLAPRKYYSRLGILTINCIHGQRLKINYSSNQHRSR